MDDERHDPSLEKLLDIGLYDRWGEMPRTTPEERAMRYSAVCTSMLADRVEDLEEGNGSSIKRIVEVEGSMGGFGGTAGEVERQGDFTRMGFFFKSQVLSPGHQLQSSDVELWPL